MPYYFFHIENGHRISSDEREEFPDDQAALQEGERIAGDLARNQIRPTGMRVIVTNSANDPGEVPLLWRAK